MERILTAIEFSEYKKISKKIDEEKINEIIELAQSSDLQSILGDFYFEVLANYETPEYSDLMNGSTFFVNNQMFKHLGLKAMLADFTMARYILRANNNFTAFGYQTKHTNDSDAVDYRQIKDESKQAQIDGNIKFKYIEMYILNNPIFTRYCNKKNVNSFNSQKIYKL